MTAPIRRGAATPAALEGEPDDDDVEELPGAVLDAKTDASGVVNNDVALGASLPVPLAAYAAHVAFGASWQPSPMQILCSCGPCAGMTVILGPHLLSNVVVRSVPTAETSSADTPKDCAESPTCWMKYPTSAAERSMYWCTLYWDGPPV